MAISIRLVYGLSHGAGPGVVPTQVTGRRLVRLPDDQRIRVEYKPTRLVTSVITTTTYSMALTRKSFQISPVTRNIR